MPRPPHPQQTSFPYSKLFTRAYSLFASETIAKFASASFQIPSSFWYSFRAFSVSPIPAYAFASWNSANTPNGKFHTSPRCSTIFSNSSSALSHCPN